jgi:acyl-CoA hydrolase
MPRTLTLDELTFKPGERVYLPGSAGEPTPLLDLWRTDPERTQGVEFLTSFVPGINNCAMEGIHATATVTGMFMQPSLQAAQASGQFRHLPLSYSGFVRHLREAPSMDVCVVHVAPPDANGRCSLGPAVEFTELAQRNSRRTIALINPLLPAMPGATSLAIDAFDAVVEVDFAPKGYVVGAPNQNAVAIASRIANFVEDGCTLQVGLGKIPDALLQMLHDRKGIRFHSGMLADTALDLWDAGALDPDFAHCSCVWVGSAALYERLRGREGPMVLGCDLIHDPARIAAAQKFTAVNSALSVDLLGQANLEIAEGHAVSGIGGAADFARGARLSPGGISIVAMPATYARDTLSRIVPRLEDGVTSLARVDIDVVVTEFGAADFRGRSVHERAEQLIEVAHPSFRAALTESWRLVRARL